MPKDNTKTESATGCDWLYGKHTFQSVKLLSLTFQTIISHFKPRPLKDGEAFVHYQTQLPNESLLEIKCGLSLNENKSSVDGAFFDTHSSEISKKAHTIIPENLRDTYFCNI